MKKHLLIFGIVLTIVSCKSKKETNTAQADSTHVAAAISSANTDTVSTTNTSEPKTENEMTSNVGNTAGKVSHKFRATGCSTIIIIKKDGAELVLIPKDKLSADFDKDGLEINFNYRPLKMPQPAGCNTGIPAEITDLSKK